jgi:aspartyl-tRNA(Asn)/glutamyl-tRNA(Gln) amidotransferase subunit A
MIMERHEAALVAYNARHDDGPPSARHYSAGGSSCGSAVSVAHGSALLSLGTDTGGSVRLPAAWCRLYGIKPSYGLLSRHGVVSYASSFDTVGILAKSTYCAATALDALAQRDVTQSRDSTFVSYQSDKHPWMEVAMAQHEPSTSTTTPPLNDIKIGIPHAFSVEECPPYIAEAWSRTAEMLEQHGATIVPIDASQISPKIIQNALSAYYVLTSAEASSNLSRYDGFRYGGESGGRHDHGSNDDHDDYTPLEQRYAATRSDGFGHEVARRILCGTFVLSSDRFHAYYEAAAILRAQLAEQLHTTLETTVDVLLIPTVLSLPPRRDVVMDGTAMFANDVMTTPASLAGLPAMSIPVDHHCETSTGPFTSCGMQLIAGRLNEAVLFRCAQILEDSGREG